MPLKRIAKLGTGHYRKRSIEDSKEEPTLPDYVQLLTQDFDPYFRRAVQPLVFASFSGYKDDQDFVHIYFPERLSLPLLPEHYAFKGGAVRECLRRAIYPSSAKLSIRDYDVIRFATAPDTYDHDVAMRYMLDDYEFGHGVEVVENYPVYFKTRDLSCNEIIFTGSELVATQQAIADICQNVIRPCDHVIQRSGEVDGRTFVKALRFVAEASVLNIQMELIGFEYLDRVTPFDISLHLDRAFACGVPVAEEFIELAWLSDLFFQKHTTPPSTIHVVRFLAERLTQGISFFKHLPAPLVRALGGA